MVEGKCQGIGFGTEFLCCFQHWPGEFLCRPDLEICHLAEEVLAVSCVVDIPDLLLNLGIERLAAFLGAVFDLEKGMEEALNHGDDFEERLPRLLGWRPTVPEPRLRSKLSRLLTNSMALSIIITGFITC